MHFILFQKIKIHKDNEAEILYSGIRKEFGHQLVILYISSLFLYYMEL
jgi:hypothetical protein